MSSSSNCRMIHDLVVLGFYALVLVAIFQIDFRHAGRQRSNITHANSSGSSFLANIMRTNRTNHAAIALRTRSCRQTQCTPFRQLDRTEQYRELQYLFTKKYTPVTTAAKTTTGDDSSDFAICEFQTMDAFSFHFPHTMQQVKEKRKRAPKPGCPRRFPIRSTMITIIHSHSIFPSHAFFAFVASFTAAGRGGAYGRNSTPKSPSWSFLEAPCPKMHF